MKMKQWINDNLFNLLSLFSKTEQPTPGELRAWALEEARKPPQPQIWYDPTIRSYPQPQKIVNPRGSYFKARHLEFMPPVIRTNTEPIDMEKDFPPWLTGAPLAVEHMTPAEIERVPTIRDLTDKIDLDDTEEVPAIVKMLNQDRQQRRQAG
jgi:hypothetical protein